MEKWSRFREIAVKRFKAMKGVVSGIIGWCEVIIVAEWNFNGRVLLHQHFSTLWWKQKREILRFDRLLVELCLVSLCMNIIQ